MPCSYWLPGEEASHYKNRARILENENEELSQENEEFVEAVNSLEHQLEVLREGYLEVLSVVRELQNIHARYDKLTDVQDIITVHQEAHRQKDLDRLAIALKGKKGRSKERNAVKHATADRPLFQQLGFDPDSF